MAIFFASAAPTLHASSDFEWGKRFFTTGNFRVAVRAFNKSLEHCEKLTHAQLSETYNMFGAIYQKGNKDVTPDAAKALAYYQKALNHAKQAIDETWETFMKSRSEALMAYQKAVSHAKVYRTQNQFDLAQDDMIISSQRAHDAIALGEEYQKLVTLAAQIEQQIYALQQLISN